MPETNQAIFTALLHLAEKKVHPELRLTLSDSRELDVECVMINDVARYSPEHTTGCVDFTVELAADTAAKFGSDSTTGCLRITQPTHTDYNDLRFYLSGASSTYDEDLIDTVDSLSVIDADE